MLQLLLIKGVLNGMVKSDIVQLQGAYAGLATGLFFTMWLGIGAQIYKPTVDKPPVSVSECPAENATILADMTSLLTGHVTTEATSDAGHGYA